MVMFRSYLSLPEGIHVDVPRYIERVSGVRNQLVIRAPHCKMVVPQIVQVMNDHDFVLKQTC